MDATYETLFILAIRPTPFRILARSSPGSLSAGGGESSALVYDIPRMVAENRGGPKWILNWEPRAKNIERL